MMSFLNEGVIGLVQSKQASIQFEFQISKISLYKTFLDHFRTKSPHPIFVTQNPVWLELWQASAFQD